MSNNRFLNLEKKIWIVEIIKHTYMLPINNTIKLDNNNYFSDRQRNNK